MKRALSPESPGSRPGAGSSLLEKYARMRPATDPDPGSGDGFDYDAVKGKAGGPRAGSAGEKPGSPPLSSPTDLLRRSLPRSPGMFKTTIPIDTTPWASDAMKLPSRPPTRSRTMLRGIVTQFAPALVVIFEMSLLSGFMRSLQARM